MKMKMVLVLVLMMAVATGAFAATVDFWVTASGGSTAITAAEIGAIGSTLTLDVWYSCDIEHHTVSGFYAWDSSLTQSNGITPAGAPTLGKLSGVATNILPADLQDHTKNWVTACRGTVAPYAYGNFVFGSYTPSKTPATTGTKLFSVTLTNIGLAAGASFDTYLYKQTMQPTMGCSVVGEAVRYYPTWTNSKSNVTITAAVPEPSSVIAALGILAPAGLMFRRRGA